jgi:VanW like protein
MRNIPVKSWVVVALFAVTHAWADEVSVPLAEIEFPVVLGTYSTALIGSLPARTQNIRLAASALDGTVLEPAQVLSFNRRVGERTLARGYQPAPVILHEARDVQVGGGVCQVASTLFDAALVAGLRATERHRHSYPIDYIPLAQEATIVWGAKDLAVEGSLLGEKLSGRGEHTPSSATIGTSSSWISWRRGRP